MKTWHMLGGTVILFLLAACTAVERSPEVVASTSTIQDIGTAPEEPVSIQRIFVGSPQLKGPTTLSLETLVDVAGYGCVRLNTFCIQGSTSDCSSVGVPGNFTIEAGTESFINTTINISARKVDRIVLNVTADAAPFCNATVWEHLDARKVLMYKQAAEPLPETIKLPAPVFSTKPETSDMSNSTEA